VAQTLAPYSYADDNPVSLTDPTGLWWDYGTFLSLTIFTSDQDYDFSAQMGDDMEKADEKAVEEKIVKLTLWLNLVRAIIEITTGKVDAESILSLVGALLALFAAHLSKWYKIIKIFTKKGKHTKNGFWSKTHYTGGPYGSWVYQNTYWRTCNGPPTINTHDRCGSPGSINVVPK
jgi:hypothetical protein